MLQQRHDTLRDALTARFRRNPKSNPIQNPESEIQNPIQNPKSKIQNPESNPKSKIQNPKSDDLWALRDVSFEVKRGEVVGIIGRNGAGKSTLLKILSRITEPTSGRAEIHGRVGSLLEVGTGFHPELTGRENIYLNGAILGMRRNEIDRQFDEIVAFAEIERFLDTPVKRYSSGMYVRLAFAVAAHLESEILLVDEVLAVGDAAFQKKCLGKMTEVANEGRTILFVSHNMGAVSSLCGRTVFLGRGNVRMIGPTSAVVTAYMSDLYDNPTDDLDSLRLSGFGESVRFSRIALISGNGKAVPFGAPLQFRLTVHSNKTLADLSIGSSLFNASGACVGSLITQDQFAIGAEETLHLTLTFSSANLAPGSYYAGFSVGSGGYSSNRSDLEIVVGAPAFQILPLSSNADMIANWNPNWGNVVFSSTGLTIEGQVQTEHV
jgi:lipopolysaccharide transport system ATP-binding protein